MSDSTVNANANANTNTNIIETSEATFERDVIERSRDVPVVVDFWATWCQPCRMLGPILEKLATEANGAFVLVKAETERLPNVTAAFGARSIPAVFAVKDGRVVDSFVGLLPESAIRSWIERLMPTPAEQQLADAGGAESIDPHAAERLYRAAIEGAPNMPAAKVGLARLLLARDRADEALSVIAGLEARGFLEPEAEKLTAEILLHAGGTDAGALAACRTEAAAHPDDLNLRFKLAEALAAAGAYPEALERALTIVEEGPKDLREAARTLMVHIFQILPDESELASEYRRGLSAAWY
jgi:putative thioredoxin